MLSFWFLVLLMTSQAFRHKIIHISFHPNLPEMSFQIVTHLGTPEMSFKAKVVRLLYHLPVEFHDIWYT